MAADLHNNHSTRSTASVICLPDTDESISQRYRCHSHLVKRACLSWPSHAGAAIGSEPCLFCGSHDSSELATRFGVIEYGEFPDSRGIADNPRGILSDTNSPPNRRILMYGTDPGVLRSSVSSDK